MPSLTWSPSQALLKAADTFLSSQTNLLHLSYQERPFEKNDPIPLYHNFLYALILLKNKEKESMQRGIEIVEHLLNFQIQSGEENGAFPRYLHEYPKIERCFEVVDILLPLFHIYNEFKGIFPAKIRERFREALLQSLNYLDKLFEQADLSYLLTLQIAALLYRFGEVLKIDSFKEKGASKMDSLFSKGMNKAWGSTRHLSKMILYLNILPIDKMPYLESFYRYLSHVWNPDLKAYTGVGLNEHFYQNLSEPTLFHFFMSQGDSKEVNLFEADFLETALLQEVNIEQSSTLPNTLSYELYPFQVTSGFIENYAYSYFNLPFERWEKRGGFYPFKFLFFDKERELSSFMLHMGSFVQIEKKKEGVFHLTFENNKEADLDISFYIPFSRKIKISSDGQSATMFDLKIPIEIDYGAHQVNMFLLPDSIDVWGQLCKGNRRSQLVKEFNQTFDWNLYLRRPYSKDFRPITLEIKIESK